MLVASRAGRGPLWRGDLMITGLRGTSARGALAGEHGSAKGEACLAKAEIPAISRQRRPSGHLAQASLARKALARQQVDPRRVGPRDQDGGRVGVGQREGGGQKVAGG